MKHNSVFDGEKRDEVPRGMLNTPPDPRKSKDKPKEKSGRPKK